MSDQCFAGSAEKIGAKSTPTQLAEHLYQDLFSGPPCTREQQWANISDAVNTFSHLPRAQAEAVNKAYEERTHGVSFLLETQADPRMVSVQRDRIAGALGLKGEAAVTSVLNKEAEDWKRTHKN